MAASNVIASQPMVGGNRPYSYSRNSSFQKEGVEAAKVLIKAAVSENLDLEQILISSSPSKVFTIADLGCSVGSNTMIAMQNLVECIKLKHQSCRLINQQEALEIQVFFNDLPSNDFNTLFKFLPPESNRQYFAAAVPGRFHGRLFPRASLHFIHSSYSLHYVSTLPKELVDKNSHAYNKGRICYSNSRKEVAESYRAQYARDMEYFLSARAEEVVSGGLMALLIPCLPDNVPASQCSTFAIIDILEASLLDMVKLGLISEEKVDSFNLTMYFPTRQEVEALIKKNDSFNIERVKAIDRPADSFGKASKIEMTTQSSTLLLRAICGRLIEEHFGKDITDELFNRFSKKLVESFACLGPVRYKQMEELFFLLKRKV